ncbi:hypothetical protein V6N13_147650 [Hibiscus sabdariffa]|uniref:Uncharacterized protein n=1 Tax=Hibiscus sabdariffa TaxID=183260 RepID=A0ABR2TWQ6_9ROSI
MTTSSWKVRSQMFTVPFERRTKTKVILILGGTGTGKPRRSDPVGSSERDRGLNSLEGRHEGEHVSVRELGLALGAWYLKGNGVVSAPAR